MDYRKELEKLGLGHLYGKPWKVVKAALLKYLKQQRPYEEVKPGGNSKGYGLRVSDELKAWLKEHREQGYKLKDIVFPPLKDSPVPAPDSIPPEVPSPPVPTDTGKPKKLRVKLGLGSDLLDWLKSLPKGTKLEVYVPKDPD